MRACIIETATGAFKYYGRVEDKTSLMDGSTPKPGFSLVDTAPPDSSLLQPSWDGAKWVGAAPPTDSEEAAARLDSDPLLLALLARLAAANGNSLAQERQALLGSISQ